MVQAEKIVRWESQVPAGNSLIFIVLIAFMVAIMWWSSRKAKQQQAKVKDFRSSLQPGQLVKTIGGVIGTVVSVDTKYEEIVIDSEGSELRFTFPAISGAYERPAFIDDDEVDEEDHSIARDQDNEVPQESAQGGNDSDPQSRSTTDSLDQDDSAEATQDSGVQENK